MSSRISKEELTDAVKKVLPSITEFRHDLHRRPAVMFKETEAFTAIRSRLKNFPGEVFPPYLETDTVALLKGVSPGKNVTLRADIDGLPLKDTSGVPWSSETGASHSCGHDGHTAILMGALEVLSFFRDRLKGSVRFVFQPAEEEGGGGKLLVEKGMLKGDPPADAVFGLHGWPGVPLGRFVSIPGPMMAAADRFTITVKGRGGHGARPNKALDPVPAAAEIIQSLQTIVSRNLDPQYPGVVSVCTIHGGEASNVIPDTVVMEGTTRYFDLPAGDLIKKRMETIVKGIGTACGMNIEFDYRPGYIPLVNDAAMVTFARDTVTEYLGRDAWQDSGERSMGAEDFSYYLQEVPGAFLRLGLGDDSADLHNSSFDFNDAALEPGIVALCGLAINTLS